MTNCWLVAIGSRRWRRSYWLWFLIASIAKKMVDYLGLCFLGFIVLRQILVLRNFIPWLFSACWLAAGELFLCDSPSQAHKGCGYGMIAPLAAMGSSACDCGDFHQ